MEKKNKKKLSGKFWVLLSLICIIMLIIVVASFIIFNEKNNEVIVEKKSGGAVSLKYSSNVSGLAIIDSPKIADTIAMTDLTDGKYFDFSVNVDFDSADSIDYEISILKDSNNSTISDNDIRIYLEKEDNGTYKKQFGPEKYTPLASNSSLGSKKGSMLIAKESKTKAGVDNYRLRMWLADTSLMEMGNYSVTVEVVGKAK